MVAHAKIWTLLFAIAAASSACGDDDDDDAPGGDGAAGSAGRSAGASGGDAAGSTAAGSTAAGGGGNSTTGGSGAAARDGSGAAARGGSGQDTSDSGQAEAESDAGDRDSAVSNGGANFFVSSQKNMTGDLGGLAGADERCKTLAAAAGLGTKTWHAYLSVEHDDANGGNATNARSRIGDGPFINVKGTMLAEDLDALHARTGDAELFIDEHGEKIPGQWSGSPSPVEHDILTGSDGDGMVMAGMTCDDWTSDATGQSAQVGHSDGLGPGANPDPPYSSWNSAHPNQDCSDTGPRGGAGRIYCFALE